MSGPTHILRFLLLSTITVTLLAAPTKMHQEALHKGHYYLDTHPASSLPCDDFLLKPAPFNDDATLPALTASLSSTCLIHPLTVDAPTLDPDFSLTCNPNPFAPPLSSIKELGIELTKPPFALPTISPHVYLDGAGCDVVAEYETSDTERAVIKLCVTGKSLSDRIEMNPGHKDGGNRFEVDTVIVRHFVERVIGVACLWQPADGRGRVRAEGWVGFRWKGEEYEVGVVNEFEGDHPKYQMNDLQRAEEARWEARLREAKSNAQVEFIMRQYKEKKEELAKAQKEKEEERERKDKELLGEEGDDEEEDAADEEGAKSDKDGKKDDKTEDSAATDDKKDGKPADDADKDEKKDPKTGDTKETDGKSPA
ncbi:hypothetical protein BJ508DRAFT_340386 [Ascobolus immersus RN42]|uniref:Ubiquitin 3 binding protein But2 C-terminal domain-containing protein n=1 Tax=Ascobolus immersus RN42 TaxID=1160509 RepID=A0A3N4IS19_ASCIM|nr:hypothetical protein BJ508DRAFT_340386 [Ascobolus immersus RN42]